MKTFVKQSFNYKIGFGILILIGFISCKKSDNQYDAAGSFEATEITVSSEVSGKIIRFDVEEGQVLQAHQIVGAIDSVQLYLREQQLLATLQSAQARRPDVKKQIAAIEEQIASAKVEQRRIKNLLKANAANQKQKDDIDAQIAVLEKQLDAQKNTLQNTNQGISEDSKSIRLQVEQVQDQLNKCRIVSPITGTVLDKYVEPAELAIPGKALFKIADTDHLILRAYVTSDQLSKIKIGQQVKVNADFGSKQSRQYVGTIAWVSSQSEFTPKTIETRDERANLVYAIKINVNNDGYLKIGMYGNVKF
jgi:HlyD family secretion protein